VHVLTGELCAWWFVCGPLLGPRRFGPIGLYGCHGWGNQRWSLASTGMFYTVGEMICLQAQLVSANNVRSIARAGEQATNAQTGDNVVALATQVACPRNGFPAGGGHVDQQWLAANAKYRWEHRSDGTIRPTVAPNSCLDRTGLKGGGQPTCMPCSPGAAGQAWIFALKK
jgi:hypothetical protein